jgi:hypothetical protein
MHSSPADPRNANGAPWPGRHSEALKGPAPMNTMPDSTDNVTPRHEVMVNAAISLAEAALAQRFTLDRGQRAEMDRCTRDFVLDMLALGIKPATATSPAAAIPAQRKGGSR